MKHTALLPVLTSCVVVEPGAEGSATTPSSASSKESDAGPAGWQTGYEKGLSDGRGGLSRTPDRCSYLFSEANRTDFFNGYESGYNRGIRSAVSEA